MNEVVVALAMWAMVAATLARLLADRRTLTPVLTALAIAISQTVNIYSINSALDALLGGLGWSNFVMMTFFVIGIYLLGENLKSATGRRSFSRSSLALLTIVLATQTVSFTAIDRIPDTRRFVEAYKDQVSAVVYSQSHFLFFGITFAMVGVACVRSGVLGIRGPIRVGFAVLTVASVTACFESIALLVRDLAGILHADILNENATSVYKALFPVVALLIALGLSIPPLASLLERRRASFAARNVHTELRAMHAQLRAAMPAGEVPGVPGGGDLRRTLVEIEDMLFLARATPTSSQSRLMAIAERQVARQFRALR